MKKSGKKYEEKMRIIKESKGKVKERRKINKKIKI